MRKQMILASVSFFLAASLPSASAQDNANVSVTVEKMESQAALSSIIMMAAVFIVLAVITFFLLRYLLAEQKKKKALKEKVRGMDKDEAEYYKENIEEMEKSQKPTFSIDENVEKYLKEDEKIIVNILRQRDGICSQATLRIVGNFSKATLSRLLVELEQRNVIKKEKRGKKNLVILR